jgi:hypothetical protein
MTYKIQFLILISTFLFSACINSQKEEYSRFTIDVKKIIELDSQSSQYLYSLYPIASASSHGEVIALPNLRNPIGVTLIDYEGNFIEQIGSEGRGPDEILSARFIGLDNHDNVVINDKSSSLIKKFDRSDKSVHSYSNYSEKGIDITSRDMKQCGEQWILSLSHHESAPSDTSSLIGIFDEEFQLLDMFGSYDPFLMDQKTILQDPIISVDCDNSKLYTTHVKVPFVQIYDLDDLSKKERVEFTPPSFKLSDRFIEMIDVGEQTAYQDFLIEEQSMSLLLAHTDKYLLLLFRNETEQFYETRNFMDREHFVAIFSIEDYSFMGEARIEGAPLGVTKEGFVINLVNDDPIHLELVEVALKAAE